MGFRPIPLPHHPYLYAYINLPIVRSIAVKTSTEGYIGTWGQGLFAYKISPLNSYPELVPITGKPPYFKIVDELDTEGLGILNIVFFPKFDTVFFSSGIKQRFL